MQPQRLIGVIVLVVGIILLVMGLRAMDSFSSQFSKFFTGNPTDRAIWLTIGGVVLLLAGATASVLPARGTRS